jgi:hypothetical protein
VIPALIPAWLAVKGAAGMLPGRVWAGIGIAAALAFGVYTLDRRAEKRGFERATAACNADKALMQQAAASAADAYRAETERRTAAQREALDEHQRRATLAAADAASAVDAAERLRRRAAGLAARGCGAAGDTALAGASPPGAAPAVVLADVLGRCVERVRQLAADADRARDAGQTCERAYDALTAPARPSVP